MILNESRMRPIHRDIIEARKLLNRAGFANHNRSVFMNFFINVALATSGQVHDFAKIMAVASALSMMDFATGSAVSRGAPPTEAAPLPRGDGDTSRGMIPA